MGKVIKNILGAVGLSGSDLRASAAPEPVKEAAEDLEETGKKRKKTRTALFRTAGGIAGEELNPDEVGTRSNTLLGN